MKYDIFISYRREGGYETAKHLNDLLVRDGYRVSFDIDTLRNGNFDTQLLFRIEECKDFILIVDKHAFDRTLDKTVDPNEDWMRCELAHALKHNKNIIPIFLSGVAGFPDGLPSDIANVTKKNGPEYNKYHFDNFYKQLCRRFLKSWSLKKKLATILLPTVFIAGVVILFSVLNSHDEVRYTDPMIPHTTNEEELNEFAQKIIDRAVDSLGFTNEISAKEYWTNQYDAESELNLGFCYLLSYGCPKDINKAYHHIANAAKNNNMFAQYSMGILYDYGIGVKQNVERAMEWCLKAAEQGLVEAICDYGIMCGCINKQYDALKWLKDAADQGSAKAKYTIGYVYFGRNNFNEALYWFEEASDQEYILAELVLAYFYCQGPKDLQDIETAVAIYEELAEQDNCMAQYALATCYSNGKGVDFNIELAIDYLKRSAEQGFAPALVDLGQLYWSGMIENVPQNYDKAMELFLKAAEKGYPQAQIAIGEMYQQGFGVDKSEMRAKMWYKKAEKQGVNLQQIRQMQQMQQNN